LSITRLIIYRKLQITKTACLCSKWVVFVILFLLSTHFLFAQNLIPNGSFEEYKRLPNDEWIKDIAEFVTDWQQPTAGSPDYYHQAANGRNDALNHGSFALWEGDSITSRQNSADGRAFVGLAMFGFKDILTENFFAEYVQTELQTICRPNHKYKFRSYTTVSKLVPHYGLEFGLKLSTEQIQCINPNTGEDFTFTLFDPPITNYFSLNDTAINDTTNWTELSYTFKAKEAYQWLTFGCFNQSKIPFSRLRTDLPFGYVDQWSNYVYTYYFVDDFSLVEIPCLVGPDSICQGEQTALYSTFAGPFQWSIDRNFSTVFSTDSIVEVAPEISTWYYLQTPTGTDSLFLTVVPKLNPTLYTDTVLCAGETLHLEVTDPNNTNVSVIWNGTDTSYIKVIDKGGYYTYNVSNGICDTTIGFNVVEANKPHLLGYDSLEHCFTQEPLLAIELEENYVYWWQDIGQQNIERTFRKEGNYPYTVYNSLNCEQSATLNVVDKCSPIIHIPNAFAPKGVNQVFRPYLKYHTRAELVMYNRWGEKIYEETAVNPQWDGSINGREASTGVYMYRLKVVSESGVQHFSGSVHLLR
jgi:gliding motility-associated-like protein